jgi:pimeloyl-ACP methyl ester carboxylesterase
MIDRTTTMLDDAAGGPRIGRRTVLGGAASAAAAGLATRLGAPATASAQSGKATFVLVPGQWTGAFVWHTVAPLLRAAGHDVFSVTCTGLGDRVHLANATIDLDTFVTDVVNVLEYEDLHEVILVGHSFGGMIITGVAERVPERLAQLVYLDADLPAAGQNYYDASFITEEPKNEAIAADIAEGMEAGMPGFGPVSPGVVEWLQSAITDPAEADWFIAKLVPHPELTRLQPVQLENTAAAALPRAYIFCTEGKGDAATDITVRIAGQVQSDPAWTYLELADTHMVNLNDPQGTAEALLSLL